jgi:hypothetical protein
VTIVERSADCRNSPKNILIENLTVALATSDVETLLGSVADDIQWRIVGKDLIEGKEDLAQALSQRMSSQPLKLTIQHVVTHGKAGAVSGSLRFRNAKSREFCDVYEFSNTKGTRVNRITSYMIDSR